MDNFEWARGYKWVITSKQKEQKSTIKKIFLGKNLVFIMLILKVPTEIAVQKLQLNFTKK